MADRVRFTFDPLCPWCYQTSRWAFHLQDIGEIELSFGLFSLELNGFDKEADRFDPDRSRAARALRTALLVREEVGEAACGRFYRSIGGRYFVGLEDLADV